LGHVGEQKLALIGQRGNLSGHRVSILADPGAPIAAVAERAGVGMSALYRRYPSKEELLQQLCADGLDRYIEEVEAALADDGDEWTSFAAFMRRAADANTNALFTKLAGTFSPSPPSRPQPSEPSP